MFTWGIFARRLRMAGDLLQGGAGCRSDVYHNIAPSEIAKVREYGSFLVLIASGKQYVIRKSHADYWRVVAFLEEHTSFTSRVPQARRYEPATDRLRLLKTALVILAAVVVPAALMIVFGPHGAPPTGPERVLPRYHSRPLNTDVSVTDSIEELPTPDIIALADGSSSFSRQLYYELLLRGEHEQAIPAILRILEDDPMATVRLGENAVMRLCMPLFDYCMFDPHWRDEPRVEVEEKHDVQEEPAAFPEWLRSGGIAGDFDVQLPGESRTEQEEKRRVREVLKQFRQWWDAEGKGGDPDVWGQKRAPELVEAIRAKIKEDKKNQTGGDMVRLYHATGNPIALGDWDDFEKWWQENRDKSRPEWVRDAIRKDIARLKSDDLPTASRAAYRLQDLGVFAAPLPDTLKFFFVDEQGMAKLEKNIRDACDASASPLAEWWKKHESQFHLVHPAGIIPGRPALWYLETENGKRWSCR